MNKSLNMGRPQKTASELAAITRIKRELQRNMISQELDIITLFKIADENQDETMTLPEFLNIMTKNKLLKEKDAGELFSACDVDKSQSVELGELQSELADINAAIVFEMIKENERRSGQSIDDMFDSVDIERRGHLGVERFAKLI